MLQALNVTVPVRPVPVIRMPFVTVPELMLEMSRTLDDTEFVVPTKDAVEAGVSMHDKT